MNHPVTFCLGLGLALLFCHGCSSTSYPVGKKSFDNVDQALAYQTTRLSDEISTVKPGHYFGGSLLVSIPDDSRMGEPPFAPPAEELKPGQKDFFIKYNRNNFNAMAAAIRRAGLFDSVESVQTPDFLNHAADYGYRYLFVYNGGDKFFIVDQVLGRDSEIRFVSGMKDIVYLIQDAIVKFEGGKRSSSLTENFKPEKVETAYDPGTRKGHCSVGGKGYAARAWMLEWIKQQTGKSGFRISSENLSGDRLTINFERLPELTKYHPKAKSGF